MKAACVNLELNGARHAAEPRLS